MEKKTKAFWNSIRGFFKEFTIRSWDIIESTLRFFHIPWRKRTIASRLLEYLFFLSLILKGIDGVVEVLAGTTLLFLEKSDVLNFLTHLARYNFKAVSKDALVNSIAHFSSTFTDYMKFFVTVILLGSGSVKIVLAISLLLKKKWAFPVALVLLGLIILYESIQGILSKSLFIGIMTTLDVIVLLVISREYYYMKKKG